jgi:RNA polymerase sigma-70 factor (ECF subfamily)
VNPLLDDLLPAVYRFAMRLSRNAHTAEELTQETLLRAWREKGKLRSMAAARVWALRITHNLWRDAARRQRIVRQDEMLDAETPERAIGPEAAASQRDEVRQALAALDSLPPRQREVLYLLACQQMTIAEIAETLDMTCGAVKSNLSLARKRLREQFAAAEMVQRGNSCS